MIKQTPVSCIVVYFCVKKYSNVAMHVTMLLYFQKIVFLREEEDFVVKHS